MVRSCWVSVTSAPRRTNTSGSKFLLSCYFVLQSGLRAPNTAGFQKVWRQSLETFITTNSYLLTRGTDTGTRIGSEDFVSGLAALSLRSER